jgi:hypothetical protein
MNTAIHLDWYAKPSPDLTREQGRDLMAAAHQHIDHAYNARVAEAAFNTYCGNAATEQHYLPLPSAPMRHQYGEPVFFSADETPTHPMSEDAIGPQNASQEPR